MRTRVIRISPLVLMLVTLHGGEPPPVKLVEGLAAEDFTQREVAQAELLVWALKSPEASAAELLKLSRNDADPEIRKRSTEVLKLVVEADYLSEGQSYIGIVMKEEMLEAGEEGAVPMGIRVLDVMPGTPAEKSDLRVGDLIVALDGKGWKGIGAEVEFGNTVAAMKPLSEVKITVRRGGAELLDIPVKLGKRPVDDLRAVAGNDIRKLEERAKELHFRQWLRKQKAE